MKRKLDMSNQTFFRFDHVNRKPTSIHMFCGSDEFPNDFRKIKRQIFSRNLVKKFFYFKIYRVRSDMIALWVHPNWPPRWKTASHRMKTFSRALRKKLKSTHFWFQPDRFVYSYNLIIFQKIPLRQKLPISKWTSFFILFFFIRFTFSYGSRFVRFSSRFLWIFLINDMQWHVKTSRRASDTRFFQLKLNFSRSWAKMATSRKKFLTKSILKLFKLNKQQSLIF